MIEVDRIPFPGRQDLHRRVLAACGPGRRFAELGYRFGDWVAGRPGATDEVERHVAGYLELAARTGRRWGNVAGTALGVTLSLVATLVWAVTR